tara:strand:- start:3674 stop:3895 length:222 start_codon:yes stop_codon:yes gene_type:complete
MKRFCNPFLSFSAFFLICLAVSGIIQREGQERMQALPAFFVGGGLIISGFIRRTERRKMLLLEIRNSQKMKSF